MRRVVIAGTLCLTAGAWAFPQGETVELPSGFYTFADLAGRLSSPELRLRAGKDVSHRAAFIYLHPRPKAEALAILEEALGLEVQLDTSRHSGSLVQNSRQRTKDRVWRGHVVDRLKRDVLDLARTVSRTGQMSEDALTRLDAEATRDRESYAKTLTGLTPIEKYQRLEMFDAASPVRKSVKLALEWDLMIATRPILMQALGNTGASALTTDDRLTLIPTKDIGPAFANAMRPYSDGRAWSRHPITQCLTGWQGSLVEGRLSLNPVLNLMGDRFVDLNNGSQMSCSLPGYPELQAGMNLAGSLYGPRTDVLDRDARDWYQTLDQSSRDFLSSADGAWLRQRPFDPARPFLSQMLLDWSKALNREVAVELSFPAESGVATRTFADRFPNWRFRLVQGVLAPVDLLGFWHRGRPLPMSALVPLVSPSAVQDTIPLEARLTGYYRSTVPTCTDWREEFRVTPTYYGIRPEEIDSGRPSFMAWSELRPLAIDKVLRSDEGEMKIPLNLLSPHVLRDMADAFQRRTPSVADMWDSTFADELSKGDLQVIWVTKPGGKTVALSLVSNPETSSEGLMFDHCRSLVRFRITQ